MEKNCIGALWLRESKKGNKFFSGVINDENVIILKNYDKKTEKSPDYYVLKNELKNQKNKIVKKIDKIFNDDDDIPF